MSNHHPVDSRSILPEDIGSLAKSLSADQLPITLEQRGQLLSLLANEQLSLGEFAARLYNIPAAALQLCREAGLIARRRDIDVVTLEQACNLLGIQGIRHALDRMPLCLEQELPMACRQMLLISQHALFQAQGLFSQRMARIWPELALASLLFLAPCWLLARRRPDLFEHWDSHNLLPRLTSGDQQSNDAQSLIELSRQLAEDWWLSPWITRGLRSLSEHRREMIRALRIAHDSEHPRQQQLALDEDRQLARWLVQPANAPLLANGVALGALHTWQGHQTLRWQQLAALYLGEGLDDVCSATHRHAVSFCRQLYPFGHPQLRLPACSLLWPDGQQSALASGIDSAPRPAAAATSDPIAPSLDAQRWRSACQRLLAPQPGFSNLQELLACAGEALSQGLGVGSHWIALYNAAKQQLMIAASHGQPADRKLLGQLLGSPRNSSWENWLRQKPLVVLEGTAASQLGVLLPAPLKRILEDGFYCLLPLWQGEQLMGLLACDLQELDQQQRRQRLPPLQKTAECLQKALLAFRR